MLDKHSLLAWGTMKQDGIVKRHHFAEEGQAGEPIRVDNMLTKFLRAHQREGLQFLFDCVTGLKPYAGQGWCDSTPPALAVVCTSASLGLATHDLFGVV